MPGSSKSHRQGGQTPGVAIKIESRVMRGFHNHLLVKELLYMTSRLAPRRLRGSEGSPDLAGL